MRFLIPVGLYVVLAAYAITDVLNHPAREPFRLHRFVWILLIVVVPYLGAVAWIVIKRRTGGAQPKPKPPRAPDDDPEYLNWAARQERRRREQRGEG